MKKIFFVFVIVGVVVAACKVTGGGPTVVNSQAVFSCKINGTPWTSVTRVTTNKAGGFSINGSALQRDALDITIAGETPRSYTLGTLQYNFTASYSPLVASPDSLYTAINGTVVLSEVDAINKRISGTFKFNVMNVKNNALKKSITDGVFTSLSYN